MHPRSADEVVQALYQAAATLADDRPALDALRDWLGAEHVVIYEDGPLRHARTCSHLADITASERSMGMVELSKLRDLASVQHNAFRHSDYVDPAEQRRSRFFHEFLLKYDGGPSAGAHWCANGIASILCVGRSLRFTRDFRDSELAAIQAVLPHIATVESIRQNLRRANQIAAASGMALAGLRQALFLIDPAGRLAYSNALAEDLLASGDSFCLTSGGVSCHSATAASRLALAVASLRPLQMGGAHGRSDPAAPNAFFLPRPGRAALCVSVVPVSGMALFAGYGLDPRWVAILVTDPQRTVSDAVAGLAARFQLTRRESELVAALAAGHTLPSAATTLGVTHETARQYLKVIFSKTGVHRQAELVRLASRLSG